MDRFPKLWQESGINIFESSMNDSDVQLAWDVICANQVFFRADCLLESQIN